MQLTRGELATSHSALSPWFPAVLTRNSVWNEKEGWRTWCECNFISRKSVGTQRNSKPHTEVCHTACFDPKYVPFCCLSVFFPSCPLYCSPWTPRTTRCPFLLLLTCGIQLNANPRDRDSSNLRGQDRGIYSGLEMELGWDQEGSAARQRTRGPDRDAAQGRSCAALLYFTRTVHDNSLHQT